MTVNELITSFDFKPLCLPEPSKEITGGYAGDLLSWVMGKATSGCAWITIMSNMNIVAVSTLTDPACIILSEGVIPDDVVIAKAEEQGVNILSTDLDTFTACGLISKIL
jgi:hypothetical protein